MREVIRRIEARAVFVDGSLRLPVEGASLEDEANAGPTGARLRRARGGSARSAGDRLRPGSAGHPRCGRECSSRRALGYSRAASRPSARQPFEGDYVYRPRLSPQGELAEREIIARPDWSAEQEALAAAAGHRLQFLVEVDRFGRITSCIPWSGIETGFDAAMARAIETGLKYARAESSSGGWLEMRW